MEKGLSFDDSLTSEYDNLAQKARDYVQILAQNILKKYDFLECFNSNHFVFKFKGCNFYVDDYNPQFDNFTLSDEMKLSKEVYNDPLYKELSNFIKKWGLKFRILDGALKIKRGDLILP